MGNGNIPPPPSGEIVMPTTSIPPPPTGKIVMPITQSEPQEEIPTVTESEVKKMESPQEETISPENVMNILGGDLPKGVPKVIPPQPKKEVPVKEGTIKSTLGIDIPLIPPKEKKTVYGIEVQSSGDPVQEYINSSEAKAKETKAEKERQAQVEDASQSLQPFIALQRGKLESMDEDAIDALKEDAKKLYPKIDGNIFDEAFDAGLKGAETQYKRQARAQIYNIGLQDFAEQQTKANPEYAKKSVTEQQEDFDKIGFAEAEKTFSEPEKQLLYFIRQRDQVQESNMEKKDKIKALRLLNDNIFKIRDTPDLYSTANGELLGKEEMNPEQKQTAEAIDKRADELVKTYKENLGHALAQTQYSLSSIENQLKAPVGFEGANNPHVVKQAENLRKERDELWLEREALKKAYFLNESSEARTGDGFFGTLWQNATEELPKLGITGMQAKSDNSSLNYAKQIFDASKVYDLPVTKGMEQATEPTLKETVGAGTGQLVKELPKLIAAGMLTEGVGELTGLARLVKPLLKSPRFLDKAVGHTIKSMEEGVKFQMVFDDFAGGAGFYGGQQLAGKINIPFEPTGLMGKALKTLVNYGIHNGLGGGTVGMGSAGGANAIVQALTTDKDFSQAIDEHFGKTLDDKGKVVIQNLLTGLIIGFPNFGKEWEQVKKNSLETANKLRDNGMPNDAADIEQTVEQGDKIIAKDKEEKKITETKTETNLEASEGVSGSALKDVEKQNALQRIKNNIRSAVSAGINKIGKAVNLGFIESHDAAEKMSIEEQHKVTQKVADKARQELGDIATFIDKLREKGKTPQEITDFLLKNMDVGGEKSAISANTWLHILDFINDHPDEKATDVLNPDTELAPTQYTEAAGVSGSALKDVVRQESDAEKLNKEAGVDIYVARQDIDTNGGKYTLSQIKENGNTNTFLIEDAKGNEVGKAQLSANGNYLENIRIDEKHRRKGLASKVYDFIELRKGIELEPSPNKQSKEAKALWDKRNLQKSVSNKANGGLLAKALGESMSKTFADFRNKQQVLLELENKYFEQKGLSKEEFNKLSENEKSEIIKDAIKWKNDNPELVKSVEDLIGKAPTQYTEAATLPKKESGGVSGSALKDVPTSLRGVKYSDIVVGDKHLEDILDENKLSDAEKNQVREIFSRGVDYFKFDKEGEQKFQEKFSNPEDITDVADIMTGVSAAQQSAFDFHNTKNYDNVKDAVNYIASNPNDYSPKVVKAVKEIKEKLDNPSSSMSRLYAIDVMKELGIKAPAQYTEAETGVAETPKEDLPKEESVTNIDTGLKNMAQGISDSFYSQGLDALKNNTTKIGGINEPILEKASKLFAEGRIKTEEDLKKFYEIENERADVLSKYKYTSDNNPVNIKYDKLIDEAFKEAEFDNQNINDENNNLDADGNIRKEPTNQDELIQVEKEIGELEKDVAKQDEAAGIRTGKIPIAEIEVRPDVFQFKEADESSGVNKNEKLEGDFDKNLAGTIAVWTDHAGELGKKGQVYVVDGHHRMEFAKRNGITDMEVFQIEAPTAKEAKVAGAKANIAQGRGTSVDAAKIFRDASQEQLEGFSPKSKTAREGKELAKLDEPIFNLVVQGKLDIPTAMAIAKVEKTKQESFYKAIKRVEGSGAIKMTPKGLSVMADKINEGDVAVSKVKNVDLFGTSESEELLLAEQSQLESDIKDDLSRDAKILGNANKNKEVLENAKNVVNVEENAKIAEQSKLASGLYDTFKKGKAISDIIKTATEDLSNAKGNKERVAIKEQAIKDVKEAINTELDKSFGKKEPVVEKTAIDLAKERAAKAKAIIDAKKKNQGIISDPEQDAKDLYEYHSALVDVAKEYVKQGVKDVSEFAKQIGQRVTIAVKRAWQEANGEIEPIKDAAGLKYDNPDGIEIGTKRAIQDIVRGDMGIEPLELPKAVADNEKLVRGKELVDSGEQDPFAIMDEALAHADDPNKLDTSPDKQFAMRYYDFKLETEKNELIEAQIELEEKLKADPTDKEVERDLASVFQAKINNSEARTRSINANQIMANAASKNLAAFKGSFDEQGQIVEQISRIKDAFGGDVPKEIQKQLDDLQSRYDLLEAKNKKLIEQHEKEVAEMGLEKARREQKKQVRQIKRTELNEREKVVVERIKGKVADIISKYAEKTGGKKFATPEEELKKNILTELASDISELMKIQLDKGILNVDGVIDGIHGQLQDVITGLKKEDVRDLIAGKYSGLKPVSELTKQLNDLRSQARAKLNIENLQNDIETETKKRGEASPEVKALQKELQELKTTKGLEKRIEDVKNGVEKKVREKGEQSDEVKALRKELADLESQEGLKKKIADLESGVVAETKKRGEASPEVKALQERVAKAKKDAPNNFADVSAADLKKQADAIQKKIDKGEFLKIPTAKKLWENNPKWIANNKAKEVVKTRLRELEKAALEGNKNKYMMGLDIVNQWVGRRMLFFGSQAYQLKLSSAALASLAHKPVEEVIGLGVSKAFPNIAKESPIEGNVHLGALADFYLEALNPITLAKNTWDIAKTGTTPLERRLDEKSGTNLTIQSLKDRMATKTTLLGKAGALASGMASADHIPLVDLLTTDPHVMIKDPIKRADFKQSLAKYLDYYQRQGLNPNDHILLETAESAAYLHGKAEIFMGSGVDKNGILKNPSTVEKINTYFNELEKSGIIQANMPGLMAKAKGNVNYTAASLYHFLIPIHGVPMRVLEKVWRGNPIVFAKNMLGAWGTNKDIQRGILQLSHNEADIIMRNLKQGAIGSAYWTLGAFLAGSVGGGLYQRMVTDKDRKKDKAVGHDEIVIKDLHVPHNAQHSTQLFSFQMGATWGLTASHYLGKEQSKAAAMSYATGALAGSTLEEIPITKEAIDLYEATQGEYKADKFADNFNRRIGVNKVKNLAHWLGADVDADPIKVEVPIDSDIEDLQTKWDKKERYKVGKTTWRWDEKEKTWNTEKYIENKKKNVSVEDVLGVEIPIP